MGPGVGAAHDATQAATATTTTAGMCGVTWQGVHTGIHEFAWFIIGAAFGALLIVGIDLWQRRPRRRRPQQTIIEEPGYLITAPRRMSRRAVAEFKRRWIAAYGSGLWSATVLDSDSARCEPRGDADDEIS